MNKWTRIGGIAAALSLAVWALRIQLEAVSNNEEDQADDNFPEESAFDSFAPDETEPLTKKQKREERKANRQAQKAQRKAARRLKRKPDISKAQVVVTNNGTTDRLIQLWGGSEGSLVGTDPGIIDDHSVVQVIGENAPIFNHPQGVGAHSDGSLFVVNQLNDSVTRLLADGNVAATIALGALTPGTISPVAISVQSNYAYVVGSVSDTVIVIDTDTNTVVESIEVGKRPIAVSAHPISGKLYVVNHFEDTVSVIDPATRLVEYTLNVNSKPTSIAFDPVTEKVYVCCQGANNIKVFTKDHQDDGEITSIGKSPYGLAYHPENGRIYATISGDNKVAQIDLDNRTVEQRYSVGSGSHDLAFHPLNGMLYVANANDQSFSVIDLDTELTTTVPATGLSIGWAIHPTTGQVFISATSQNALAILGFDPLQGSIEISDSYFEKNAEFRYNPAKVLHTKWVHGIGKPVRTVTIKDKTATGSEESTSLSLANYESPQHGVPVAEINNQNGWILDGKQSWDFQLCAGSSAIIIIYFQQWKRVNILPND